MRLDDAYSDSAHRSDRVATVYGLAGPREVLHLRRVCDRCHRTFLETFCIDGARASNESTGSRRVLVSRLEEIKTWWVDASTGVDMDVLRRMHVRFFREHATFEGEASVATMVEDGLGRGRRETQSCFTV